MLKFSSSGLLLWVTVAFLVVGTSPAGATVLMLNLGNDGIDEYPQPYGTVEVTLLSGGTQAQITATATSNDRWNYLFGNGGTLGLNTNGGVQIVGGLSGITAVYPFDAPSFISAEPRSLDGWGTFNFVISNYDGFGHSLRSLAFTLEKASGVWSSDHDVLTPNASGYLAATHVFVANADWTNTGDTGYATHGATAPEPSTLVVWLLGGVSGLAGWRRRKRIG